MSRTSSTLVGVLSLFVGLGAAQQVANAEGLAVTQANPEGTVSVTSAPSQPPLVVAHANTSSTPLPASSEPEPAPSPQPATTELQAAANPQPATAGPAVEAPPPAPAEAPPAPTPVEAAQPTTTPQETATPQTTEPESALQPATGAPAEAPPPVPTEAPPTATVVTTPAETGAPAIAVPTTPAPTPTVTVESSPAPTPSITVTHASPPTSRLQAKPASRSARPVDGEELQGGEQQTSPTGTAPQDLAPSHPLQGSSTRVQGDTPTYTTSTSTSLQPTTSPEHIGDAHVDLPPATGGSTNATPAPPKRKDVCVTVTAHELIGGGFRYCDGPSRSLVVIAGVGEGGGVSVDRQNPDDRPSASLHAELSDKYGIGSAGASGDLPLHGEPSVSANVGALGYGPEGTITRTNGALSADGGIEGPLPKGKKSTKKSQTDEHGTGADASVDVEVPVTWHYLIPDTLFTPIGRHLFFGF
jgi:hypothetical protein